MIFKLNNKFQPTDGNRLTQKKENVDNAYLSRRDDQVPTQT